MKAATEGLIKVKEEWDGLLREMLFFSNLIAGLQ